MGDEGAKVLNLPSSSAERDHGLCERLRKSPRSAEPFFSGDEKAVGPSILDCACVRERSNTDLYRVEKQGDCYNRFSVKTGWILTCWHFERETECMAHSAKTGG